MPVNSFLGGSTSSYSPKYVKSSVGQVNQQLNQTLGYEGLVPVGPKPPVVSSKVVTPQAISYATGGGGGGGGGAGVTAPVAPTKLNKFQLSEIEAVLDAIGARYDYEGQALHGQKESLLGAFKLLMQEQEKQKAQTLHESKAKSSGSGRIRSGLFLKDQSRIADAFADQLIRAQAERDAQLSPLQQALGSLQAREDAEKAAKAREIALEQLGTQEALAQALALV